MAYVETISARWILDSRGNPTIHCVVQLEQNGINYIGSASVPSGASTGVHEALELRDGEEAFGGKGVTKAVNNILTIITDKLNGQNIGSALEIDEIMLGIDKTENKAQLGANAILAVSMASYRAFANLHGLELWQYLRRSFFSYLPAQPKFPRLMMNILNGGQHADNPIDIQEFMIIPKDDNPVSGIQIGAEIYQTLKKELKNAGQPTGLGDEGGFAPMLPKSTDAMDFVRGSIQKAGFKDEEVDLALDVAASEFYDKDGEIYKMDGGEYKPEDLIKFYSEIVDKYGIISIEDGMDQDDIEGWKKMTDQIGFKSLHVGDDLFVTNVRRFEKIGLDQHCANAILIKPNQIGSIKETCEMINTAKQHNFAVIVSHRSGETPDDFIADLAFAAQSDFIKAGAPARGERVAKYNRLLDIYASLN